MDSLESVRSGFKFFSYQLALLICFPAFYFFPVRIHQDYAGFFYTLAIFADHNTGNKKSIFGKQRRNKKQKEKCPEQVSGKQANYAIPQLKSRITRKNIPNPTKDPVRTFSL